MTQPKSESIENPLPPPNPAAFAKERKAALDAHIARLRASAWSVHRFPLTRYIMPHKTRVHLPRLFLGRGGKDVRTVWEGTDLNTVVYWFYAEQVDKEGEGWVNYVHEDKVLLRRHEFLGPDPRVAGYWMDEDGDMHVRWYDGWLKEQWMDKQKWSIDMIRDPVTGQWKEDALL